MQHTLVYVEISEQHGYKQTMSTFTYHNCSCLHTKKQQKDDISIH